MASKVVSSALLGRKFLRINSYELLLRFATTENRIDVLEAKILKSQIYKKESNSPDNNIVGSFFTAFFLRLLVTFFVQFLI